MSSQLETLTEINLDDLVSSFGWEGYPLLASILRRLFARPARKFANQMVEFDTLVGGIGLAEASRRTLQKNYVRDVRVHGRENVPADGPILFLSNHPGMSDTLCLFSAINRVDLRIIAIHRPFLEALRNTTNQLFFIDEEPVKRMNAVRQVAAHLKNGGAALTFPAGEIEPDPDVYDGALDSLDTWTDSAGVFMRLARDTKIVPVLVSSVVWDRTARHPLTRLKRTRTEREKLAAALQILVVITQNAKPNTVHVRFAEPITLEEIGSTDSQNIHTFVINRMRGLIQNKPKDEGISAL
ncbi:MAG: 1-acyl-sn-glycerol-3-phosphate acyltransferase [Anaerolineales bacterium]|nr:MAG: 1-acyl-sn-glycerol-3-phosphate acyltransferase [Anaerolineales bacterium]